ncbi:hypothetical protein JCM30237_19100 [Halolamina litorea]|jgi:hypothetical protein|uniref:DUF8135 domain-containing protein n=1 Tax=Halolamina litorea TaxID=1515593 RepID=A0ABD6BWZ7_9EURY|nr:hypothetical protein [Halolamina litorea]
MSEDDPVDEPDAPDESDLADDLSVESEELDPADDPSSESEEALGEERDLPLSDLRKRVEARQESNGSFSEIDAEGTTGTESDLFEEVDVADVDSEAVWDAVVEGDADAAELLGDEPGVDGAEPAAEPAADPAETADEHVIDKREYCQRCEFFAAPPEATCTNEGTEIVELVDNDSFRVRDCPKVAVDDEALSGFAREE